MSAIFGIIDFKGRPLQGQWIHGMRQDLTHRGVDGIHIAEGDSWALGHALMAVTPEAQYENQPLQIGHHWITAEARLDEREAIMDRLQINPAEREKITDPELLLRSYLQFGPDFVKDIYGDFAFVIWDDEKKEAFIARDQIGVKPVLYYHRNGILAFSTEMKALVHLPFVDTRVNERYIKIHCTGYTTGHETTAWENIYRLPPATYLYVSTGRVDKIQYWNPKDFVDGRWKACADMRSIVSMEGGIELAAPLERGQARGSQHALKTGEKVDPLAMSHPPSAKVVSPLLSSPKRDTTHHSPKTSEKREERTMHAARRTQHTAALRLRELMEQAVRDRLRGSGPVGIPLSGGLDSSTIAALAIPILREQGRKAVLVSAILEAGGRMPRFSEGRHDAGGQTYQNIQEISGNDLSPENGHPASSIMPALASAGHPADGGEPRAASRELNDETEFIAAFRRMYPSAEYISIKDTELSFTETLDENIDRHYHPENYFYYLDDAINERLQAHGVKRVLSGYVGDTTVSNWAFDPIPYLIRSGRLLAAFRLLLARAKSKEQRAKSEGKRAQSETDKSGHPASSIPPPAEIRNQRNRQSWLLYVDACVQLSKQMVKAVAPESWLMRYHHWREKDKRWSFEKLPVKWTEEERVFLTAQAVDHFKRFGLNRAPVEDQIWDMGAVHFNESWNTGPAHYGIEFTYPFADRRIIEFLLSLPIEFFEMDGRKRGLIRRAMEGLLPDEILDRETKNDYSPGYPLIFRRDFEKIVAKFKIWAQTADFAPWAVYFEIQRSLENLHNRPKRLTFGYSLFYIKNLFIFLSFYEKHADKS